MNYLRVERILVIWFTAIFLYGCATPYQQHGAGGGYKDQFIGNDKWHIMVRGNGLTSFADLEQHFYRRSQEITKQNGYSGYKVESLRSEKIYHLGWMKPVVRGIILCYKGTPPTDIGAGEPTRKISFGTCWVIADGYVATNYHVIDKSKNVYLILSSGERVNARVVAQDRTNDLAVLSIDHRKLNAPAIPFADQQANAGTKVFTVGYPHPTLMGATPKVSDGIVSATTGLLDDPRLYQISVPLQSGNSGGPLLNMRGEVVGVATSKLNAAAVFQWTGDLPENVNYAMKIQYLEPLINPIGKTEKPGDQAKACNLEELSQTIMRSVFIVVAE